MNTVNLGGIVGLPKIGIPIQKEVPQNEIEIPGQDLPRAVTYMADHGGCSWYRCLGPDLVLNLYQKCVITDLTTMVLDPRFYFDVKAIKVQRQATPQQLEFVRALRKLADERGIKMIYEIDDIPFREDIPLYNKNREAFTSDEIRYSAQEAMELCDEVTVTCDFMRDYFKSKLKNQKVTVIPNYVHRMNFDRYYNLDLLLKRFEKNKRKKHVISIFASGTHTDVAFRNNSKDDFEAVVDVIIKTRTMFTWKFYGTYPFKLHDFIMRGEILHVPWYDLLEHPQKMYEAETSLTFAALQDNNFNRAKSNIKLLEAGAMGIPCVCPDMVTYNDAILKYKTGDEFIDTIKHALKDQTTYASLCKRSRAYTENFWLEDEKNYMKFFESYFTSFGDNKRKYIGH